MPTRRQFLHQSARSLAALATATAFKHSAAAASRPPNIVFILADDLGWGDLGCYGSKAAKTPNLDRLAAEGLRLGSFYVNSPVCSPTRTEFMTGRFPSALRIHAHFATPEQNEKRGMPQALDPNVVTLADILRERRYATGHFGKWHLGELSPREYGFDESRVYARGGTSDWDGVELFWRRSSELIADETLQFIDKHREQPFFVNMWTHATHAPLDPSTEHMAPFHNFRTDRVSGTFTTPHAVYYGALAEMDRNIGRVLAKLDELGLRGDTIVVFSSDNGPEDIHISETAHSGVGSQGPFRGRKRSLYEGGVRTPFIVRRPGHIPAGRLDMQSVVSGVDFVQTICSLADINPPAELQQDGENRAHVLTGMPSARTKPLFWLKHFPVLGDAINMSPMLAIRDGDWKLLMNPDKRRIELYDIRNDPLEVDNRADANAELVQRLADKLLAWHATIPEAPADVRAGAVWYPWPS